MKGGKKRSAPEIVQPPPSKPKSTTVGGVGVSVDADEAPPEEDNLQQQPSYGEEMQVFEVTQETQEEDEEGEGDEENSDNEKDYDNFGNLETEEAEAEGEAERPKLADGYYEIEAVRKKRVRKGQLQYLIKWRDWSEAENTWEPLENLLQCADVIDAFEESLRTGKTRSSRKRKRKQVITHTQSKKRQPPQQSPPDATYNVPAVRVRIADDPIPFPSINHSTVSTEIGRNDGHENGVRVVGSRREVRKEQNELDFKLCELRGGKIGEENANKFAMPSQESLQATEDDRTNGLFKAGGTETVQSGRCIGAKKRKSGSVKRFQKDSASCAMNDIPTVIPPCAVVERKDLHSPYTPGNDMFSKNISCHPKEVSSIIQIIRPISYGTSISNNIHDVAVTFEALRSDGTTVMVDNKFLKVNNPLLLINFYERHLRYNPTG